MKILFIHADYLNYEVKKETGLAEDIPEERRGERVEDPLIVFLSVEGGDEDSGVERDQMVERALAEIEDIASQIKVENIVLFPFAHLSEDLASPDYAISLLRELESKIRSSGLNCSRVPFGWYKEFEFKNKGHPLSVLSRTVRP